MVAFWHWALLPGRCPSALLAATERRSVGPPLERTRAGYLDHGHDVLPRRHRQGRSNARCWAANCQPFWLDRGCHEPAPTRAGRAHARDVPPAARSPSMHGTHPGGRQRRGENSLAMPELWRQWPHFRLAEQPLGPAPPRKPSLMQPPIPNLKVVLLAVDRRRVREELSSRSPVARSGRGPTSPPVSTR